MCERNMNKAECSKLNPQWDLRLKLLLWPVSNRWCQDFYFNLSLFYLISVKCAIREGKRAATSSSGCLIYTETDRQTKFFSCGQAKWCSLRESENRASLTFQTWLNRDFILFFFVTAGLEFRDQWLFAYQLTNIKSLPGIMWPVGTCLTEQIDPGTGKNILAMFL